MDEAYRRLVDAFGRGWERGDPEEILSVFTADAVFLETPFSDKRSEEHTSELQSRPHLVCRLLLEKKKLMVSLLSCPGMQPPYQADDKNLRSGMIYQLNAKTTPGSKEPLQMDFSRVDVANAAQVT